MLHLTVLIVIDLDLPNKAGSNGVQPKSVQPFAWLQAAVQSHSNLKCQEALYKTPRNYLLHLVVFSSKATL